MSFVFSNFLASFPVFSYNSFVSIYFLASFPQSLHGHICFQKHTGFVRTIFCSCEANPSRVPQDHPAFPSPSGHPGARLRQCVHKQTIMVGYHRCKRLSSGKCKKSERTFPNSLALPHGTTPGRLIATKCRFVARPWPENEDLPLRLNVSCLPERIKRLPSYGQGGGTFWNDGRS